MAGDLGDAATKAKAESRGDAVGRHGPTRMRLRAWLSYPRTMATLKDIAHTLINKST